MNELKVEGKIPTVSCPVFLNGNQCQLMIQDTLTDLANATFIEVAHKLAKPVPSIPTAINIMSEAARHCADVPSSKAEMLVSLQLYYGVKDPLDEVFLAAAQDCAEARTPTPKSKIQFVPSQSDFDGIFSVIDDLRKEVSRMAENYKLYLNTQRRKR